MKPHKKINERELKNTVITWNPWWIWSLFNI